MNKMGLNRLRKEYEGIMRDPPPNAVACPEPKNWFRWHFAVLDLDGPYKGGVYHGELRFPSNYPMGAPAIIMHTPSGRFDVETRICTSMSDFHQETWSPSWKVSTIITGFISFMLSDEASTGTVSTSKTEKIKLARQSKSFNLKNPKYVELFQPFFSRLHKEEEEEAEELVKEEPVRERKDFTNLALLLIAILILLWAYFSK